MIGGRVCASRPSYLAGAKQRSRTEPRPVGRRMRPRRRRRRAWTRRCSTTTSHRCGSSRGSARAATTTRSVRSSGRSRSVASWRRLAALSPRQQAVVAFARAYMALGSPCSVMAIASLRPAGLVALWRAARFCIRALRYCSARNCAARRCTKHVLRCAARLRCVFRDARLRMRGASVLRSCILCAPADGAALTWDSESSHWHTLSTHKRTLRAR